MGGGETRAVPAGFSRLAVCVLVLLALGGNFLLAGCASAPMPEGSPIIRVIDSAKDFPNRVTAGRVSLGYPDDLWVIFQGNTYSTQVFDKEVESVMTLVGDEDFSHGFTVGESTGMTFDEVLRHAETAQEEAPQRAALLEEKAKESEMAAQMFSGLADHYRNVVYREPELAALDGHRALIWGMSVTKEGVAGITRLCLVEVDQNTLGFVMCGYRDCEYNADPAFWDDIFSSLEVR